MCEIRRARAADLKWIVGQLKEFSKFFGSRRPLFQGDAAVREKMDWLMREHLFFMATGKNGKPLGFIAGIVTPHLLNPTIKVLAEALWWVEEKSRGSRAGLKLLEAFVDWGRENVDWVTFSLETKSPVNERVLTGRGFCLQERSYLLEV